jgi:hypothetical protein
MERTIPNLAQNSSTLRSLNWLPRSAWKIVPAQ